MSVAVCLIHTARLKCTRRAIDHLRQTEGITPHIFLLVQGPQNEETEQYLSTLKYVTVIQSKKNVGCWPGRQLLLELIRGAGFEYVLIIDNDVFVPPNWFVDMEKTLLSAPQDVVAVGMVLDHGGGKFYGGFDFGIRNGRLIYSPIQLPYDGDLVCDACSEGAMMIHRDNISLLQTDLLMPPYSGYDLLLNIWSKGKRFVVCNGVVGLHQSYPTKEYVRIRYHESAEDTYKKFCEKWSIRLGWRHEVGVRFPVEFPRIWGYLKYSRQNIYKVLRWFVLPMVFLVLFYYTAPFYPLLERTWWIYEGQTKIHPLLEFSPFGATGYAPNVLLFLYGTVTLVAMWLMVGHVPLLIIPFLALGLAVFATDYWEWPYFLLKWIPVYVEQVISGIRTPVSFLWSSSFLHLYGGMASILLLKIKWSKKSMLLFLCVPWIMWLLNRLYPIPSETVVIHSPLFGALNPLSIIGSVMPWLSNRVVCSISLLYLLRYVRWRGVWKLYREFTSKLSILKSKG